MYGVLVGLGKAECGQVEAHAHRSAMGFDAGEVGMKLPNDARREYGQRADHRILHSIRLGPAAVDRSGPVSHGVPAAQIEELLAVGSENPPYIRDGVVHAHDALVFVRGLNGGAGKVVQPGRSLAEGVGKRPEGRGELKAGCVKLVSGNHVA